MSDSGTIYTAEWSSDGIHPFNSFISSSPKNIAESHNNMLPFFCKWYILPMESLPKETQFATNQQALKKSGAS